MDRDKYALIIDLLSFVFRSIAASMLASLVLNSTTLSLIVTGSRPLVTQRCLEVEMSVIAISVKLYYRIK